MCGIAGIIDHSSKENISIVDKMLEEIRYRGPDQKNSISGNFFDIGAVRLSIQDLSDNGNQPFFSRDKNIISIYNGEIYNYKDLKKKYFKNHYFKGSCDGEIIPYMYQKFGLNFVDKLKGMFAICVIDIRNKKTILVRDRFGIKPFYFCFDNKTKQLSFASEIHQFFKNKNIVKEENIDESIRYLRDGYVQASNSTWFKKIKAFEPGTLLIFTGNNDLRIKKYYDLANQINENIDKKEVNLFNLQKENFSLVDKSFEEHILSDVKIGLHISGGIDSLLLACAIKKKELNVDTFTFDYNEKKFSEVNQAKEIANNLGFKHYSCKIKDSNLIKEYEDTLKIQFEPFSSLRVVSQNFLYKNFKDKCRVILDGNGGDEISAGYKYHQIAWLKDMEKLGYKDSFKSLVDLKNLSKKVISNFIKSSKKKIGGYNRITEDGIGYSGIEVLNKEYLKKKYGKLIIKKPFKSILRNCQYKELFDTKMQRCLRYVDRMSMRQSIETRVPLLDHELVENFFNIPMKFKIVDGQQRYLMKQYCKNFVSKKIYSKNKVSIADPQTSWLKNQFKEYALDTFNSKIAKENEIINYKKLNNHYKSFLKEKKISNSFFLFQCLNYLTWKEKILKN